MLEAFALINCETSSRFANSSSLGIQQSILFLSLADWTSAMLLIWKIEHVKGFCHVLGGDS